MNHRDTEHTEKTDALHSVSLWRDCFLVKEKL
jgi:hypothetical protein